MILLTGASGFIGKKILEELIITYGKENVVALTSKPIDNIHFLLHNDYHLDSDFFTKNLPSNKIETIIHAGAFIPKDNSQANDIEKCNSNIYSLQNLLSCNFPSLKKIIYLSSIDVYDVNVKIIAEDTSTAPVSLYGFSKLYGEAMISKWAISKNITYQILRIGHVYGPGEEFFKKIIPITIKKILKKEDLQIWGTGNEIRSFINVGDVVKAILKSINLKQSNDVINVVGSQQITITELVNTLLEISNANLNIEIVPQPQKGKDYIFDNTKMKELLLPEELPLLEGLQKEFYYMANITL